MRGLFLALSFALLAQQPRDLRIEPLTPSNPLQDSGTRWAVILGISSYKNLPPVVQLHYAHRDAASCIVLDHDLVTVVHEFAHARGGKAHPVFLLLDLSRDANQHRSLRFV